MSPILHKSDMDILDGGQPAIDSMNRINKLAAVLNVVEKTASYTCKAEESATVFIANHASTPVNFTLPTIATALAGVYYDFFNVGAAGMVVTSDPADKLVTDNDVAADTLTWSTGSHTIGGCVRVVCDGAKWLCFGMSYVSTAVAAS